MIELELMQADGVESFDEGGEVEMLMRGGGENLRETLRQAFGEQKREEWTASRRQGNETGPQKYELAFIPVTPRLLGSLFIEF